MIQEDEGRLERLATKLLCRNRAFEGHVGQIASQAEFLPRNVQTKSDREHQVFGVKIYVDNAQQVLKSGMSATVRLE